MRIRIAPRNGLGFHELGKVSTWYREDRAFYILFRNGDKRVYPDKSILYLEQFPDDEDN